MYLRDPPVPFYAVYYNAPIVFRPSVILFIVFYLFTFHVQQMIISIGGYADVGDEMGGVD